MRRLLFPASPLSSTTPCSSDKSSCRSKTSVLPARQQISYFLLLSTATCCCLTFLHFSHYGQHLSTLLPFLHLYPAHTVTSVFAVPPEPSSPYSSDGYTPDWDHVLAPPTLQPQTIHLNLNRDDVTEDLQDLSHIILTTGSLLTSTWPNVIPHLSFSLRGIYALLPPRYLSKPLLIRMGDGIDPAPFPVLTKARVINDSMAILMPIEYERHFGYDFHRLVEPEEFGESSLTAAEAKAVGAADTGGAATSSYATGGWVAATGSGVADVDEAATNVGAATSSNTLSFSSSSSSSPVSSSSFSSSSPPPFDPPFREKAPQAIWRGVTTGGYVWDPLIHDKDNHRKALIDTWGGDVSPKVDVAFTGWCQGAQDFVSYWSPFLKPSLPQAEQLQYRYLISVEGNDVATGLKWMLASNSVVFMPMPRREIWSREGLLMPWVHFIPVQADFSDLLLRIEECERDLERCEAVSERASKYMKSGFGDIDRTYAQAAARLREYLDKVTIEIV